MNDYFSNVIDGRFIGEDGSMGLGQGKVYIIKIIPGYYKGNQCLWVFLEVAHGLIIVLILFLIIGLCIMFRSNHASR